MATNERIAVCGGSPAQQSELAGAIAAHGFAAGVEDGGADLVVRIASDPRELEAAMVALRNAGSSAPVMVVATADTLKPEQAFELGCADVVVGLDAVSELCSRIVRRLSDRRALGSLARRQRGLRMVLELTQALSSTTEIHEILYLVVSRVAEVIDVDRVSIVLVDDDGSAFVIAASDDQSLRDLPISLDAYPEVRQVLDSGEPLLVADAEGHPLFALERVALPSRFRALTLFPIRYEDRAMGVLFMRFTEPRVLDSDDELLLGAIANATGIAMRNASVLRDLRAQHSHARVEAEKQVAALQPYADFFDSSADGILVVSHGGQVLFCNPAACGITRYERSELLGTMVKSMLSPDGKKRFAKLEESFAEGIFPHDVDLPILTKEGVRRVLNVSFSSVLREEHSLIVTMRDVTEERSMARELTRTKEFLQRVIDSSVDAIVSADMKGQVLLFNPAAEDIYGYFAEEVLGNMNVSDLYPTGVAHRIMQLIRSESQGGAGVLRGFETELLGKDGRLIPVMLSAALIVHRGRPIGSVGVFKDLRAERSFVRRLEAAQKELEAQEKNAFIAELAGATAHELNQPLTTVMGYAGMLERQLAQLEGQPRLKKASTAIVRETERMAEIVRKIGKLTKYESKSYVGETKIIDIERSIDSDPHVNGL